MIITIKTLQQNTFTVEVDEGDTAKTLKEAIEKEKGEEFPAEHLRLIYGGKILDETKPLSAYKIKSNNFVVVMVTKPRGPPPQKTSEEASEATPTSVDPPVTQQESSAPVASTETTTQASGSGATTETTQSGSTDAGDAVQQAGSTLVTGDQLEDTIRGLTDMGYSRELAERALNLSFNNPDRAANMLLEGMVDEVPPGVVEAPQQVGEQPSRDTPPAPQPSGGQLSQPPQPSGGQLPQARPGDNPLGFLRSQPQFQRLADLLRSQPESLSSIIQSISISNPHLFQLIRDHRQDFLDLLNEPSSEDPTAPQPIPQPAPQPTHIQVTVEEKAVIDRLMELGNFQEELVVQMYFACDKNEEMTANALFEHM